MSKKNDPKPPLTLWDHYKQTVIPLKKSKKKEGLELQKKIEITIQDHSANPPAFQNNFQKTSASFPQESLLYQSPKKIRKNINIQSRLDLHSMTQEQAFKTLAIFIQKCFAARQQDVLVITGKGIKRQEGKIEGGVLRRQLPLWLEHPDVRSFVHFYTNSHPFEGGTGAYYIRLRKLKKDPSSRYAFCI